MVEPPQKLPWPPISQLEQVKLSTYHSKLVVFPLSFQIKVPSLPRPLRYQVEAADRRPNEAPSVSTPGRG